MELMNITDVSKTFGVSTRTLRYYEKIGLLKSTRREDYAYRVYAEDEIDRLKQIIILRKLRIPLKQIAVILESEDAKTAMEIFSENISELSDEIMAMSVIKQVLEGFVDKLSRSTNLEIKSGLLDDTDVIEVINTLSLSKSKLKEEVSMAELNKANEKLAGLKDVRIVYLPPSTVAAAQYEGENPEEHASQMMMDFIQKTRLWEIKPDLRQYGFNNPQPSTMGAPYGYEFWVTIPDDMEVPAPLEKKHFAGGMYAAHAIKMGDFHEWALLDEWVKTNGKYVYGGNTREQKYMFGSLEEELNFYSLVQKAEKGASSVGAEQLDLLIPVVEKE